MDRLRARRAETAAELNARRLRLRSRLSRRRSRSRRSPSRPTCAQVEERERLARRAPRARARATALARELPLRAGRRRRRGRGALLRHGHRRPGPSRPRFGSACATATTTTCCSRRSRASSTGPPVARPPVAGRGTCARPRRPGSASASASTARAASRRDRLRALRPPARTARLPRRARSRARRTGDLETGDTTRPRTRRSRSARRSTGRSAIAAGSRATATPSCRWTRRRPRGGGPRRPPLARARARSRPGLAAHMLQASRRRGGSRSTSRRRDATRITPPRRPSRRSAARCAPRSRRGGGVPSTKGRAVKSRSATTARGTCARSCSRFERLGAEPESPTDTSRAPSSPCCPGVGSAARRWRGCASAGWTRRCASARRRPADARHLPWAPARARRDGGGRRRRRARAPPRAARPPGVGTRAADRLGAGRARAARRTTSPTPTPPRRRRDRAGRGIVAGPELGRVRRRPVPSGEERRRRRALARGAMPLPRLIPCLDVAGGRVVKGVRFEGLRDVGDPVELGARYSRRGADELVFLDVTATLEGRGQLSTSWPGRRPARDPVHRRRGRSLESADAEALLRRAQTRSRVNSAALERPELVYRARGDARLAGGRRRDRRRRRAVRRAAGTAPPAGTRSSGRARRRSAAQARSCSPRSTPTARAPATTSRSRARSRRPCRCP